MGGLGEALYFRPRVRGQLFPGARLIELLGMPWGWHCFQIINETIT